MSRLVLHVRRDSSREILQSITFPWEVYQTPQMTLHSDKETQFSEQKECREGFWYGISTWKRTRFRLVVQQPKVLQAGAHTQGPVGEFIQNEVMGLMLQSGLVLESRNGNVLKRSMYFVRNGIRLYAESACNAAHAKDGCFLLQTLDLFDNGTSSSSPLSSLTSFTSAIAASSAGLLPLFKPFIFRVCSLVKSCLPTCILPT